MKEDQEYFLHQHINFLQKECAYLQRKLARLKTQQTRQEKIDDINRNLLKKTNEKLHQYHDQVQRENISKSDFLANMSHEIRTPLNIILGMANLLADTDLNRTQIQYLSSLRLTGRQLMEILNNILEFSRIEAGKIIVEPEPFSLLKIINQIESSVLPLCLQKKLQFLVKYDSLLVMERQGDPTKIVQILLNLINNAVKFTQQGTITLEFREDFTNEEDLLLRVCDTGIGIAKDQQKLIFDRFTFAHDSLSQQHSGAGLGLAISQKLTDAMGGEITVESEPGEGSVFTCRLPLPKALPSDRRKVRIDASVIPIEHFPRLRILAVDDVKENLAVIKEYLKDYPITLKTAENGREALDVINNEDFDLILMDIRMPVMDGITAAKAIRAMEEKGKERKELILAVTAHAFREQKNKFLEAGFSGVLTKPFFKRELIQTIYKFAVTNTSCKPPEVMGNKAIGFCLEHERPDTIPGSLRELVPELLASIAQDLDRMEKCLEKQEKETFSTISHSLKGVAGMFGFQKLADLITDLSISTKSGNSVLSLELFQVLKLYLSDLQNTYKN